MASLGKLGRRILTFGHQFGGIAVLVPLERLKQPLLLRNQRINSRSLFVEEGEAIRQLLQQLRRWLGSVTTNLGQAMELTVIAAAVIGGANLAGRRFVIRQAFGCAGPTPPPAEDMTGDGLAAWSWGDRRQSLRLTLAPGDWTASPLIAGGAVGENE